MELGLGAVIVLISVCLGYYMGKGKELKIPMPSKKFKPIVRTDAEENKMLNEMEKRKAWLTQTQ